MAVSKLLPGQKTYILISLALVAGVANYVGGVVTNGFNIQDLLSFINGEAATAAIAMVRLAVGKK